MSQDEDSFAVVMSNIPTSVPIRRSSNVVTLASPSRTITDLENLVSSSSSEYSHSPSEASSSSDSEVVASWTEPYVSLNHGIQEETDDDGEVYTIDFSQACLYKSAMDKIKVCRLRHFFGIKSSITVRAPVEDERVYDLKNAYEIALYEFMFRLGFRLPFHSCIRDILSRLGVAPTQLAPNAWRVILGSLIAWRCVHSENLTGEIFIGIYALVSLKKFPGYYFLSPRNPKRRLVRVSQTSNHNWKTGYFYVGGDWEFLDGEVKEGAVRVPRDWGKPSLSSELSSGLSLSSRQLVDEVVDAGIKTFEDLSPLENLLKFNLISDPFPLEELLRPDDLSLKEWEMVVPKLVRCRVAENEGRLGEPKDKAPIKRKGKEVADGRFPKRSRKDAMTGPPHRAEAFVSPTRPVMQQKLPSSRKQLNALRNDPKTLYGNSVRARDFLNEHLPDCDKGYFANLDKGEEVDIAINKAFQSLLMMVDLQQWMQKNYEAVESACENKRALDEYKGKYESLIGKTNTELAEYKKKKRIMVNQLAKERDAAWKERDVAILARQTIESEYEKKMSDAIAVAVNKAKEEILSEYHQTAEYQELGLYYIRRGYDEMKVRVRREYPHLTEEVDTWAIDDTMGHAISLEFDAREDEKDAAEAAANVESDNPQQVVGVLGGDDDATVDPIMDECAREDSAS